jgi:hypothetical protein
MWFRASPPKCPNDGCRMGPFRRVKAPPGCPIALHGCRFCDFDRVVARATDGSGNGRFVAAWRRDPAGGVYVLESEHGRNPPGWLELTCAALPQRT